MVSARKRKINARTTQRCKCAKANLPPASIETIFELIDALPPRESALFRVISLHGIHDPQTGAVLRSGLLDSATIQIRIEAEQQHAEHWARRAEYYANEAAGMDRILRAYYERRNRRSSPDIIQLAAQVIRLKDDEHLPWKQIGRLFGMSADAVRKLYKRHYPATNKKRTN